MTGDLKEKTEQYTATDSFFKINSVLNAKLHLTTNADKRVGSEEHPTISPWLYIKVSECEENIAAVHAACFNPVPTFQTW